MNRDEKKELMLKQQEAMSNGSVAFLSYRSSCTVGFGMSLGIQFICDLITNMVTLWNWFVFSSAYGRVHAISVLINWAIAVTTLIKMH